MIGKKIKTRSYLGTPWGVLEASWGRLGVALGRLGGHLGGDSEASWVSWRRLKVILGATWRRLGRLGGVLEASWGRLGGVLEVMLNQDEPRLD